MISWTCRLVVLHIFLLYTEQLKRASTTPDCNISLQSPSFILLADNGGVSLERGFPPYETRGIQSTHYPFSALTIAVDLQTL